METKEAIEKLKIMISMFELGIDWRIRKEQFSGYIEKFNGIIDLLEQGEENKKYKQKSNAYQMIWILFMTQIEKLIEDSYMVGLPCGDIKDIAIKKIHDLANELEQRYLKE